MRIYILRHAEAVDAREVGGDEARHLTPKGEESTRRAARGMKELAVKPDAVWTSPLPRALGTARITAETLGLACPIEQLRELRPGADPSEVTGLLQARLSGNQDAMVVGHNPDLEDLAQYLISKSHQAQVTMKKGALAMIEADRPLRAGCGTLVGLWTAKQLALLGE